MFFLTKRIYISTLLPEKYANANHNVRKTPSTQAVQRTLLEQGCPEVNIRLSR
jgi:hypothetical protein